VERKTAETVALNAATLQAPVIAFTYNEPTVFTEYLLDIAREARKLGLRSVLVTCGLMNEAPLADMCRALDAIKVDLKGYSESFYRNVCGAELKPVLRSIKQIAKPGSPGDCQPCGPHAERFRRDGEGPHHVGPE